MLIHFYSVSAANNLNKLIDKINFSKYKVNDETTPWHLPSNNKEGHLVHGAHAKIYPPNSLAINFF